MGRVILQTLQASDSQKTYSDKANYNFHLLADYINGVKTIKGDKGNVGMPGATGRQGIQGEKGNSLFVYEGEFPYSTSEDKYEDLKNLYITWCDANEITDGDLVLFKDNQSIYKSGVNNEEKVPDKDKDLVVDLSKIINEFVTERDKGTTFWDRIDQDRDVITVKQYLDPLYKANAGEDITVVLAPELIADTNGDLKNLVINNVSKAPLNIFSTVIGGGDIEDIYNQQSGISFNSIYALDENSKVEDKDREFRITQRSVRVDNNQIDCVEGLFVVAPRIGSSQKEGLTSGFRFISQKAQNSDSDFKKNNIVTIGDGKFTNEMLMNGYGGDKVENAITFARGEAIPTSDDQFGGYFSIGTEYDNNTVKGFIRTASTVKAEKGDLVIGGYNTFLTLSYDADGNKIYTKNQNIKIYSVDGSIERGLYINNDDKEKSILLSNENDALCNIKLDNQITQTVKKDKENTVTEEISYNKILNTVSAQEGEIQNIVNKDVKSIISTNRIENKITNSFVISQRIARTKNNDNVCDFTLNIITRETQLLETPLHITAGFNPLRTNVESEYTHNNQRYTVWVPSMDFYERLDEENHSYWINTYNKKLTITNVYGGDILNLVFPLIPAVKEYDDSSALIQFKTYKAEEEDPFTKWIGGIYLIPYGTSTEERYTLNYTNKVSVYKNYGIQIKSSTELKLNAAEVNIKANTINIGDANTTVNIAGSVINGFGGHYHTMDSEDIPYLWKAPIFAEPTYELLESDTYITGGKTNMPIFYFFDESMCLSFTKDMIGFWLHKKVKNHWRAGIRTFIFRYKFQNYDEDQHIKQEDGVYYIADEDKDIIKVSVNSEAHTKKAEGFFNYAYLKEKKTIRIYPWIKDYEYFSEFLIKGKFKDVELDGGYVYIVLHLGTEILKDVFDADWRATVFTNEKDYFFNF